MVTEIFSNPVNYSEKSLPVIGDIISRQEMVDAFIKVTGKKAIYSSAFTQKEFLDHFPEFSANETLVREIIGMSEYAVEYGYFSEGRDLQWSRKIDLGALSWEQFLRTTNWQGQKQSF